MAWFRRKNEIDDAIEAGQLDRAIELTSRLGDSKASKNYRQQLTEALIRRAKEAAQNNRLPAAWQAISQAASFAETQHSDLISQTTQQLQQQTLEMADAKLQAGQSQQAAELVQLLTERSLSSQQSDQISSVATLLTTTDRLVSAGKSEEAIESLEDAQRLYPELAGLKDRIADQQKRKSQLDLLTDSLQSAALSCQWNDVGQLCDQILELAPNHEIALGAKRHARQRVKRRTSVGSRLTNVPESKQSDELVVPPSATSSPVSTVDSSFRDTTAPQKAGSSNTHAQKVSGEPRSNSTSTTAPDCQASQASSFLIWVDGVGGYLVCTKPVNFIGQAIEGSSVSIPLQADVRQRHARVETISGQHLIQPLGDVAIDGREVPVDESIAIRTGQQISLGAKVRLVYRQDHPLSKSARLDYVSRHRTLPWSDGVILAGQSIVLGPNPNNHVFCPSWKSDLVLFRRSDKWFAKSPLEFCVDEHALANESEIRFDSRVFSDSFSLKLEPVFLNS
ncbi:hypothetical protein N9Y42_04420 [Mariniblastus sp.]|nr:hypothetical protein [Mariniblastus sp.]